MAERLEHVHLLTPDHRATAQWYQEKLGARVVEEYEAFGLSSI
ncbi:MAG: VOC family protein, partial [Fidelibacterota bacterium]